jgi:hypothetical protein
MPNRWQAILFDLRRLGRVVPSPPVRAFWIVAVLQEAVTDQPVGHKIAECVTS